MNDRLDPRPRKILSRITGAALVLAAGMVFPGGSVAQLPIGLINVEIDFTVLTREVHSGDLQIRWGGLLRGGSPDVPGGGVGTDPPVFDSQHSFSGLLDAQRFQLERKGFQPGFWEVEFTVGDGPPFQCTFELKLNEEGQTVQFTADELTGTCTRGGGYDDFAGRYDVGISGIEVLSKKTGERLVPGDPSIRAFVTVENRGTEIAPPFAIRRVAPQAFVHPLSVSTPQPLCPANTATVEFEWDTEDQPPGEYQLTFRAESPFAERPRDHEGNVLHDNTADNEVSARFHLEVRRDLEIVSVEVDPERPLRLDPDDSVRGTVAADIAVQVRNNGEVEERDLQLTLQENPGGIDGPFGSFALAPGETRTLNFRWDTAQLPAADFGLEVQDPRDPPEEVRHKKYALSFALTQVPGEADVKNNRHHEIVGVLRDRDRDGIADVEDKCLRFRAAPVPIVGQADSDGDGIGNSCDVDYNQDGAVGFPDLSLISPLANNVAVLGAEGQAGLFYSPIFDHDADGRIDAFDLAYFHKFYDPDEETPAEESGLACACATSRTSQGYKHPTADIDFTGDDPLCLDGSQPAVSCDP